VQPLFEHRLDVAGYDTRVLELEGEGPGLLLLHGWGDSADTWRPLLAELGARDRRAIAVDLPGFGTASPLRDGPMLPQFDAFAEALVREWSGGEDVVVVGNSLGGVTALRLAARAELPLAGVVPVAPAGLQMPRWFDVIERDPLLRRLLALPLPIAPPVLRAMVGEVYRQLVFARPRAAEAAVVAAFAAHHASRERVAALLASGRRLLPELQTSPFEFERVRCPVLLVWGTRDRMVPHTGARILIEALPHTHVELLDGVGHCPQLEATERLLELLLPFPAAVPA
jgi:pimeloyl-ACP methyl ester carboxylesterase